MATNEELEKRIESLEKEVQHLKAVLQYQMRNKKKWFLLNSNFFWSEKHYFGCFMYLMKKLNIKNQPIINHFLKNNFRHWYLEHICFYIYKTTWYD